MEEMKKNDHDVSVAVEDEKEENKKNLLKLIKTGLTLLVCIIIAILAAIAWFSMNRETSISGMSITTSGMPFEIEVRGQYIENESDFGVINDYISGTYGSDAVYENGEQPDENYQYFRATALKDKIIWRKETQDEAHGHYADGLEPNSCGELKFWVVAKQAGFHDPKFVFDIKGYHAVTHSETQNGVSVEIVDDVYEINNSLGDYVTEDPTLTSSMVQKKKMLFHIFKVIYCSLEIKMKMGITLVFLEWIDLLNCQMFIQKRMGLILP